MLRSWALPRGLPTSSAENRLAVEVDDHDLDHLTYEDADKDIADIGWWEEHDRTDRRILLTLHGRESSVRYALIRTDSDWLMHRTKDQSAIDHVGIVASLQRRACLLTRRCAYRTWSTRRAGSRWRTRSAAHRRPDGLLPGALGALRCSGRPARSIGRPCRSAAPRLRSVLLHIAGTAACCGPGSRVIRRSCPRTATRTRWDASTAMWEGSAGWLVSPAVPLPGPTPISGCTIAWSPTTSTGMTAADSSADDPRPPAVLGPGQVAWSRPAGKNHGLARGEPPVPADREPPDPVGAEIADPPLAAGLGAGGRSHAGRSEHREVRV